MTDQTIAGVRVFLSRDKARDKAWGIYLNTHPELKALLEADQTLAKAFGAMWVDCWKEASIDAIRRNDQSGILALELARRLQEHIDLIFESEGGSAYWRH